VALKKCLRQALSERVAGEMMKAAGYGGSLAFPLFAVMTTALLSCGDGETAKVDAGVRHVKRTLERVKEDYVSAVTFASALEMGADVTTYVTASTMDPGSVPHLIWQGPAEAYSIVIRPGDETGEYVIEGYGKSTVEPRTAETVSGLHFTDADLSPDRFPRR
jgi:hypothetical protein